MDLIADTTLDRVKYKNFTEGEIKAVREFFVSETTGAGTEIMSCPYCGHDTGVHAVLIEQPRVYRRENLKKVVLRKRVELLQAYCLTCAKQKQTKQVMCFKHHSGFGEMVGEWKK